MALDYGIYRKNSASGREFLPVLPRLPVRVESRSRESHRVGLIRVWSGFVMQGRGEPGSAQVRNVVLRVQSVPILNARCSSDCFGEDNGHRSQPHTCGAKQTSPCRAFAPGRRSHSSRFSPALPHSKFRIPHCPCWLATPLPFCLSRSPTHNPRHCFCLSPSASPAFPSALFILRLVHRSLGEGGSSARVLHSSDRSEGGPHSAFT